MINTSDYVLYHGNFCPDGFGAAFAAWLKLGPGAKYIPVNYGQSPPDMPGAAHIYIVDFSYPRDVLKKLANHCQHLVVLDHHITAAADLEGFGSELGPQHTIRFETEESGATMAWTYFHHPEPVPLFFQYLRDRDLWKNKLPHTVEVSMALRSYPQTFETWKNFLDGSGVDMLKGEGMTCVRVTQAMAQAMVAVHQWVRFDMREGSLAIFPRQHEIPDGNNATTGAWWAPVANAPVAYSEVGALLLHLYPKAPFAAYYRDMGDGTREWGLRSRPGFDCSAIARKFGGGGHAQASGFRHPMYRSPGKSPGGIVTLDQLGG